MREVSGTLEKFYEKRLN